MEELRNERIRNNLSREERLRRKRKRERRRQLQRNKFIALVFLLMLGIICVVNVATGDRKFSEKENRALEQRPQLTLSGIESGRWDGTV